MNPWIYITLMAAGVVFVVDLIVRRKTWKNNTKGEKISLLVNMFTGGPYVFLSALGMLWGISFGACETAFGQVIYDVTLAMGAYYFVFAFAAMILSLIFRKKGKIKASIRVNVIALAYIVIVLAVNYLASILL